MVGDHDIGRLVHLRGGFQTLGARRASSLAPFVCLGIFKFRSLRDSEASRSSGRMGIATALAKAQAELTTPPDELSTPTAEVGDSPTVR